MSRLSDGMRERVAGARLARMATVRPDGRPHVVPVTFALHDDTIVTAVDHKPKTTTNLQRLRNIGAQPGVSLVIDHYDDDWSELWWVRADGLARIVTEGPEHRRAAQELASKYHQYAASPPRGPAILITVTKWVFWP